MRFLFFTDLHIRGNNPRSRKDNFVETLKAKLNELVEISINENIDKVLFGGDLFDRPDVSISVVKDFIKIIKNFPTPILCVIGNHDVYGQNPNSVNRTILGLLEELKIVEFLDHQPKIFYTNNGKSIQVTGSNYYYNVDGKDKSAYIVNKKFADYAIHVVHGFLLEKPFNNEVNYTLIDDIAPFTAADVTLAGHYHNGFGIKNYCNKYFINPGAISRISNALSEIRRIPSYVIIDIDSHINTEIRPLKCAQIGENVLDREKLIIEHNKNILFNKFVHQITSYGNFELMKLENIISEIAKHENISEIIKNEALNKIALAQDLISKEEVNLE
ncbi:DNA repair exonuclease SbcCD nuclease subunit [Caloramator fervidus]|uniref:DNA repair exonuclease SbcCD nuclease subunit n=1 Tax=Caloramator fervidus TaxID=29344 RepID=A0A1H5S739_9CLOT|nr:metallophosphoesterase [Caloramator fervidus]SEF46452.1 DNA repair exonuclease SbcCD nuclease subunit [Caloramator fervidus]